MNEPSETSTLEALTLQKIGRNVVNFQRMEAMLKFVLQFANFSSPLSTAAAQLSARRDELSNRTLGNLVEEAARSLRQSSGPGHDGATEAWVSHSIVLEDTEFAQVPWRRELRKLVRERNAMIHQTLAQWNPRSEQSCRELCARLDEQRERIRPAYEILRSLVETIRESHRELAIRAETMLDDLDRQAAQRLSSE